MSDNVMSWPSLYNTCAELLCNAWRCKGHTHCVKISVLGGQRKEFCEKTDILMFGVTSLVYNVPPEPPLPSFRVKEVPPFTYAGVDYAGPLFLKGNKGLDLLIHVLCN